MARTSISSSSFRASARSFTLLEVVVASGLLAVGVVAVLGLQNSLGQAVMEVSERGRAAQLADAIEVELCRLRDLPLLDGQPGGLAALARVTPASGSADALRLVAPHDGTKVVRESDADAPGSGVDPRSRFFLIEARQQPAPLSYASGAGFLALTLTVTWPYHPPGGSVTATFPADSAAPGPALVINLALNP